MKITKISGLYKAAGLLFMAGTLYSCTPGASPSSRKKMPEFNTSNGLEGPMPFETRNNAYESNGGFGFTTNNVDMMLDGNVKQFVSVALPNSANDSLAVSLVNSFKPMALPLLSAWAQQQRNGVVIDLSNHNGEVHRTDYVIEKANDFTVPVVIMWDQPSASRVVTLKNMVEGVPSIKLSCTSGYDPAK